MQNKPTPRAALAQVLDLLPVLTSTGLFRVRKNITALLALQGYREAESGEESDWLLEGIIHELKNRGLGETIPRRFRIDKPQAYHGYLAKAERVRVTLEKAIGDLNRIEKLALGRLAARVLAGYIYSFREVTLPNLLGFVHLTIDAMEDAFPGYLSAGALRFVLKPEEMSTVNL